MESAPPSYETATTTSVWQLVAPYLSSVQLCAAALVSRQCHAVFTAQLWGQPTSHFGLEYNGVLDHFARYQETLSFARSSTRSYTYCLQLKASEAIYFDNRSVSWLKDLLETLPNLQSLLVAGVPFFDHAACHALQQHDQEAQSSSSSKQASSRASYHLRLLDASRCDNLTSSSLALALSSFTSLVYLDLSYTGATIDDDVLDALRNFYRLKVLKLRATRLRDSGIQHLVHAVNNRLYVLDIRDNLLTSAAVDQLVEACCSAAEEQVAHIPHTRALASAIYQAYVRRPVNRLTLEDNTANGLQDLQVSGNDIGEIALLRLMQQRSLRNLDFGSISKLSLTQLVDRASKCHLQLLRIDHRLVQHLPSEASDRSLTLEWLSHLQTLTLTDVPTHSHDRSTSNAIIRFLETCALEYQNAISLAKTDYTAAPDSQRDIAGLHRSAAQIFALSEIVLEVTDPKQANQTQYGSSLTEDEDSAAMWNASEADFSFFRDDDGTDLARPSSRASRMKFNSSVPLVDNIALLAAFRRQGRETYESMTSSSKHTSMSLGYWPGILRIVRDTRRPVRVP